MEKKNISDYVHCDKCTHSNVCQYKSMCEENTVEFTCKSPYITINFKCSQYKEKDGGLFK